MKVRIKKLSKKAYGGQQSDGALDVTPAKWGGGDMETARKGREVQKSLTSVPREKANLEAEGGETAFGPISGDTIPDHYKISGPRHTNGGVPLNLPDDTFIFSDTRAMRITDPKILKMFGKKAKKGGYTPAELAKPYDINKYKEILMDPDSDRKDRETAELMIKNYIMKLGALALAQESKKGFPQGIPEMARPYMEANGITDEDLLPQTEEGGEAPQPMMMFGGTDDPVKPVTSGTRDFTTHFTDTSNKPIMRDQPVYDASTDPNLTKNYMTNRKGEIMGQAYVPAGENYNSTQLYRKYKKGKVQGESFYDGEYKIGGALNTYKGNEDGSTVDESKQKLEDLDSYKNATEQQRALFQSLTPEQRKMLMGAAGQQQTGQQTARDRMLHQQARMGTGPFAGQQGMGQTGFYPQQGYIPQTPFAGINAFGRRAFTRDFDYLTPFKSPTYTGTNMPFTGSIPQGSQLTSMSQTYRKNPLLKSMFAGWIDPSKNVARRELTTTYNFNGAGSKTPGLPGSTDNKISNFQVPGLDFTKGTAGTPSTTGTEAGSMSNREFARKYGNEFGIGSRRDIRKALRKGDMSQADYMQAMSDDHTADPVAPTTGSGPIPKPDNSAIPSWITDPIGSALSSTGSSTQLSPEISRMPIQPAGMLSRPTSQVLKPASQGFEDYKNKLKERYNEMNYGPGTFEQMSEATGQENIPIQKNDEISNFVNSGAVLNQSAMENRWKEDRAQDAAGGSNFIFESTPAVDQSIYNVANPNAPTIQNPMGNVQNSIPGVSLSNYTPFDFSTDRTQPTYTFGQDPINTPLDTQGSKAFSRTLAKEGVDDGRDNPPESGNLFGFNEGGIIGYDENGNPIYAAGTEPEIVDPWFDKAYYGDRDMGVRKAGDVDFSIVDYIPKTTKGSKGSSATYQKVLGQFPADVFDFSASTMESVDRSGSQDSDDDSTSSKERIVWGPIQSRMDEQNFVNAYKDKNFYPRRDKIYNWYNESVESLKNNKGLSEKELNKALFDLQVTRDNLAEQLEQKFDEKYSFQDYDVDLSSRPSGELTGTYTGQSTASGPGYGGEGQGFKRAFGGENPILDMFVYGGNYEHGGFHIPTEDYAKNFQANTSTELGKLPGTFTASDPYVNPVTGASPAVVFNSETRGLDETNPEYAEGNNPFSVSTTQKVESGFTFRPDVAMGQLGALGRWGSGAMNLYNSRLNNRSGNQLAFMQDSKETTRPGGEMANEQGRVIKQAISEGSVQQAMTKFGGTPMAMYGANMGGAYYPTMSTGGTRRVRILPKANKGAVVAYAADGTPMTQEQLNAYRKNNPNAPITPTKKSKEELIKEGYIDMGDNTLGRGNINKKGSADRDFSVPTNITNTDVDVCAEIKKGRGGKSFTRGEALAVGMVNERTADNYTDCYRVEETEAEDAEFVKVEPEEVVDKKTGKKTCKCYKLDQQGKPTKKIVSKTIVNADEDCPICEATVEVMRGADPKDPGGASDAEIAGMVGASMMRTRMPNIGAKYISGDEAIPTIPGFRIADLTAKARENARAMKAAGLSPAATVAALTGPGMGQLLTEQGKRAHAANVAAADILTRSGLANLQNRQAIDKFNTALFNQNLKDNVGQREKEIRAKNAKDALMLAAYQQMQAGLGQRAALNFELEDWQVDRNMRPYQRYNPKDPALSKPGKTRMQMYADYLEKFGKDDPNIGRLADADYKESKGLTKYGGFIPRYNTMPFGN